ENLGWRLHRVWSTEWFQRRQQEIDRLRDALEAAKKPLPSKAQPAKPQTPAVAAVRKVEVGAPASAGAKLPGTTTYPVARLRVEKKASKADLHANAAKKELQRLVAQLAREEGPIHIDLAIKRLRQAWNLSRAGDRVRGAVDEAAAECVKRG